MSNFLQIHFLTPYTAALLNRDENGLAKRLSFGGASRTRVSSQCLKRHWRMADDVHALNTITGFEEAYRSRETINKMVLADLGAQLDEDILKMVADALHSEVYGEKGTKRDSRQTLLLGQAEIDYLRKEASKMISEGGNNEEQMAAACADFKQRNKKGLKAMREEAKLPGGLTGALFGRMVTSDKAANIDAAIHVAHAFTVHPEEAEDDYFAAIDDLAGEGDMGADLIQETEINSSLFYGYVVVDLDLLISNVSGNQELAAEVLHNLVYLIAEVTPGAKKGSTAPYSRASFMLVESGNRQPRSLADAFRKPVQADVDAAVASLGTRLAKLDAAYDTGEARMVMNTSDVDLDGMEAGSLAALAGFARATISEAA